MTTVVREGLPGAVTTANSTQVVWCDVVWIVNEHRWHCCVPPQKKLCRMPYVLCLCKYRIQSHDASINSPLTRQMAKRVVNAPSCMRQPVLKKQNKTKPSFLLGGVSLRNDKSCTTAASLSEVCGILPQSSCQRAVKHLCRSTTLSVDKIGVQM